MCQRALLTQPHALGYLHHTQPNTLNCHVERIGELLKTVKGRKIKLEGFNNLTKSLSFNIYDICYARSKESQIDYLEYIDEEYNAEKLNRIVRQVIGTIDAELLSISTQDYEPRGASVTALIAEGPVESNGSGEQESAGEEENETEVHNRQTIVGHLDKSHITVHTYPEHDPGTGLATFRVDIDVSTCGMISPLRALHYLIDSFDSDVVLIDYRVRGFTRDSKGRKHFIDHDITSIQDYISDEVLRDYLAYDINIVSDNIFHTKMRKKKLNLSEYLFGPEAKELKGSASKKVKQKLEREITEIFECQNI